MHSLIIMVTLIFILAICMYKSMLSFFVFRLQTRQWSERVIRKEIREWKVRGGVIKKEVQVVVTPRVQEEVRKHYGCDTLSGAELEDQGEEGTALTHWEKRLFEVCKQITHQLHMYV